MQVARLIGKPRSPWADDVRPLTNWGTTSSSYTGFDEPWGKLRYAANPTRVIYARDRMTIRDGALTKRPTRLDATRDTACTAS